MKDLGQRIKHEVRALVSATVYFGAWITMLVVLKQLILDEYHIPFRGFMAAVMGTLVLSKVVLLLEPVSLGNWVRRRPAWIGVTLRTILYASAVFVILVIEKAIDLRHEYGGTGRAFKSLFQHPDMDHVWANGIALTAALLGYNIIAVLRRHLGDRGLLSILRSPIPERSHSAH